MRPLDEEVIDLERQLAEANAALVEQETMYKGIVQEGWLRETALNAALAASQQQIVIRDKETEHAWEEYGKLANEILTQNVVLANRDAALAEAKTFLERWLTAYTLDPNPKAWLTHHTREFLARIAALKVQPDTAPAGGARR